MTIHLTTVEVARLLKPVRGEGGWQRLLRRLQAQLNGSTLTVSSRDAFMIRKYRDRYGKGGWQKRLSFLTRLQLDTAA